jgi:hypothetical protein
MYVAPTPFALAMGLTWTRTLIIPSTWKQPVGFKKVGDIVRIEADNLVIGYEFDLKANKIFSKTIPNPAAGKQHCFAAYRKNKDSDKQVTLIKVSQIEVITDEE